MADYSIISDISAYIVGLLRNQMCPTPISSPENIVVSSPTEQDVNYLLGLYLYDIREEGEMAMPALSGAGKGRLQKSPRPYSLYYMIFVNGSSQMGLKPLDIQKIIGRVAQVINDGNLISPQTLQAWLEAEEAPIALTPAKLAFEDKVRVWSALNQPYQVGLYYKAAPVFLSSQIFVDAPRVLNAQFRLSMTGEEKE